MEARRSYQVSLITVSWLYAFLILLANSPIRYPQDPMVPLSPAVGSVGRSLWQDDRRSTSFLDLAPVVAVQGIGAHHFHSITTQ